MAIFSTRMTCIFALAITLFSGVWNGKALAQEMPDSSDVEYVSTITEFPIDCITPPDGFVTPEGFQGYVHWSTKSSILVTLVQNRTLVDAQESLNDDYYKANGVTFVSKEEVVTHHNENALLYKFSFEVNEMKWYRYSLFLGNLNGVLWINASFPEKYTEVVEEEILESLLTTKFEQYGK